MPLRIGIISAFPDLSAGGSTGGSANPVVIDTNALPGASVGVAYSATLTAHGGRPPYTWSVVSGALPTGLSLDSAGNITGTPTGAGTFIFTVQAVDPVGSFDTMEVRHIL